MQRSHYCCATFLDSHFKLEAFTSEEATKVIPEITELVKKISTTQLTQDNQDGTKSLSWTRSRFSPSRDSHCKQSLPSIQSSEITAYLTELTLEETNYTLQFQKTAEAHFPALSNLARKSLALTASSALVEQVFSILGKIHRPERARAHE